MTELPPANQSDSLPTPRTPCSEVLALRSVGQFLLRLPRPVAWFLPVLWGALIWKLSDHQVDLGLPSVTVIAWLGNGLHAFEFGVLALLCLPALGRRNGWVDWRGSGPRTIVVLCLAYAWLDEWHQSHVPGRSASMFDWITDAVGIMVSLAVALLLTNPLLPRPRLMRALVIGVTLCGAAAGLATAWDYKYGAGWWPFPF